MVNYEFKLVSMAFQCRSRNGSSPRRDVPTRQDDQIELIASQMEWHNDQSGNEHSDEQFGDDQGRVEGPGCWQENEWLDLADPHPICKEKDV